MFTNNNNHDNDDDGDDTACIVNDDFWNGCYDCRIKSEIFESLEKWGADGTLKAPYIHKVFDGTLGGQEVRSAFQLIANRKATGKVVVSFKPTSRLWHFSNIYR